MKLYIISSVTNKQNPFRILKNKIFVYFYFISMEASIRVGMYYVKCSFTQGPSINDVSSEGEGGWARSELIKVDENFGKSRRSFWGFPKTF